MADIEERGNASENEVVETQDEAMIDASQPVDEEEEEEDEDVDFIPPSVHKEELFRGESFDHFSEVPECIKAGEECVMGIDEAGRGPVLGKLTRLHSLLTIQVPWCMLVATCLQTLRCHFLEKLMDSMIPNSSPHREEDTS
jgi:hypothetical protein